jgi:hypothetical protein
MESRRAAVKSDAPKRGARTPHGIVSHPFNTATRSCSKASGRAGIIHGR